MSVQGESIEDTTDSETATDLFHKAKAQTDRDGFIRGEIVGITHTTHESELYDCINVKLSIETPCNEIITVVTGSSMVLPSNTIAEEMLSRWDHKEIKFREVEDGKVDVKGLSRLCLKRDDSVTVFDSATKTLLKKVAEDTRGVSCRVDVDDTVKEIDGEPHIRISAQVLPEERAEWFFKIPTTINIQDPQTELEKMLNSVSCNSPEVLDGYKVIFTPSVSVSDSVTKIQSSNQNWSIVPKFNEESSEDTEKGFWGTVRSYF